MPTENRCNKDDDLGGLIYKEYTKIREAAEADLLENPPVASEKEYKRRVKFTDERNDEGTVVVLPERPRVPQAKHSARLPARLVARIQGHPKNNACYRDERTLIAELYDQLDQQTAKLEAKGVRLSLGLNQMLKQLMGKHNVAVEDFDAVLQKHLIIRGGNSDTKGGNDPDGKKKKKKKKKKKILDTVQMVLAQKHGEAGALLSRLVSDMNGLLLMTHDKQDQEPAKRLEQVKDWYKQVQVVDNNSPPICGEKPNLEPQVQFAVPAVLPEREIYLEWKAVTTPRAVGRPGLDYTNYESLKRCVEMVLEKAQVMIGTLFEKATEEERKAMAFVFLEFSRGAVPGFCEGPHMKNIPQAGWQRLFEFVFTRSVYLASDLRFNAAHEEIIAALTGEVKEATKKHADICKEGEFSLEAHEASKAIKDAKVRKGKAVLMKHWDKEAAGRQDDEFIRAAALKLAHTSPQVFDKTFEVVYWPANATEEYKPDYWEGFLPDSLEARMFASARGVCGTLQTVKLCSECQEEKVQANYSSVQWSKQGHVAMCSLCSKCCSQCQEEKVKSEYDRDQWDEPVGHGLCTSCNLKTCSMCKADKPHHGGYSTTQWKRPDGKCEVCVSSVAITPVAQDQKECARCMNKKPKHAYGDDQWNLDEHNTCKNCEVWVKHTENHSLDKDMELMGKPSDTPEEVTEFHKDTLLNSLAVDQNESLYQPTACLKFRVREASVDAEVETLFKENGRTKHFEVIHVVALKDNENNGRIQKYYKIEGKNAIKPCEDNGDIPEDDQQETTSPAFRQVSGGTLFKVLTPWAIHVAKHCLLNGVLAKLGNTERWLRVSPLGYSKTWLQSPGILFCKARARATREDGIELGLVKPSEITVPVHADYFKNLEQKDSLTNQIYPKDTDGKGLHERVLARRGAECKNWVHFSPGAPPPNPNDESTLQLYQPVTEVPFYSPSEEYDCFGGAYLSSLALVIPAMQPKLEELHEAFLKIPKTQDEYQNSVRGTLESVTKLGASNKVTEYDPFDEKWMHYHLPVIVTVNRSSLHTFAIYKSMIIDKTEKFVAELTPENLEHFCGGKVEFESVFRVSDNGNLWLFGRHEWAELAKKLEGPPKRAPKRAD